MISAQDLTGPDADTLINHPAQGILPESHVQKTAVVIPIIGGIDGNTNQLSPLPCRAGYQDPPSSFGKPRLHTVGPLHTPEKLIVVRQPAVPDLDLFC